jgi:hypothetical protein
MTPKYRLDLAMLIVVVLGNSTLRVCFGQTSGVTDDAIGVQFVQAGPALTATQIAGVIPQDNFNPVYVANSAGTSGTTGSLIDTNGYTTGITLTHVSNDGFNTLTDTTTPNGILLHGEDKTGPAGQNSSVAPGYTATYTFNNVPAANYDLIAYIECDADFTNQNNVIENANLTVGPTTYFVTDQAVSGGTPAFQLANNTNPNIRLTGNYVEFFNVAPISGEITLTNAEAGGPYNTAAINGLQLTPVSSSPLPNLPIPTQAPSIDAYPNPTALYGPNTTSFLQLHGSEFSPASQQLLVANSTPQQLQGDSFWKSAATGTGAFLGIATSATDLVLTAQDSVGDAAKDIALDVLPAKYQNFATAVDIGAQIGYDLATKGDPVADLVAANSYIYGQLVAPQLLSLGQDPEDPNYAQAVMPAAFSPITLSGTPLVNALVNEFNDDGQAGVYLNAANTAYNRYCTALKNSDAISAGLQLESILSYLTLYRSEMADGATDLSTVNSLLPSSGLEMTYDPQTLLNLQQDIEANGLPADTVSFLESLGLDQTDVDQVEQNILALDPNSFSGDLSSELTQVQSDITEPVPEPASLALLAAGLPVFLMRRRRLLWSRNELKVKNDPKVRTI